MVYIGNIQNTNGHFDEEDNDNSNDVIEKYITSDDKDELDLSSCNISNFPERVVEVATAKLMVLNLDYNNLETLPPLISRLNTLVELTLNGNELIDLPPHIEHLKSLQVLSLNENRLYSLPEQLGELHHLKSLAVVGNNLTCLPSALAKVELLEELYLDENQLSHLPRGFGDLRRLKVLEVCHNQLTYLPDDIGNVTSLEVLSCGSNEISKLPGSILKLRNIRYMDFSHNKIQIIPDGELEEVEIRFLEKLYLENNTIELLPSWLTRLEHVEEITLSDNSLGDQPFDVTFCRNMRKLRKLEAGTNFVSSLASNFGDMAALEYVHLGSTISELERSKLNANGNWLKEIPDSICKLTNIKKLNISENEIGKLPANFGSLRMLTYLDLCQNMLVTLPDSFVQLSNLEYLQLSKNLLKELPQEFGYLQKLSELRLDHNLLTAVPDSMGDILTLQALDLFHNGLTEIPSFIGKMRNLKRLDIDRNEFTLDMSKVPRILPEVKYPKRNPSLKDNWRGKYRADKYAPGEVKEIVIDAPVEDDADEEEEISWNENALREALERGMSMWRSHNGPATRDVEVKRTECEETFVPLSKSNSASLEKENEDCFESNEDWDEDVEENLMQTRFRHTCEEKQKAFTTMRSTFYNIVQRYPPSVQAFSSTAYYDSLIYGKAELQRSECLTRPKNRDFVVTDGQFDDHL